MKNIKIIYLLFIIVLFSYVNYASADVDPSQDVNISIISPSSGSSFQVGDTITISWQQTNVSIATISLRFDSWVIPVVNNHQFDPEQSIQSIEWTIPDSVDTRDDYHINILGYNPGITSKSVSSDYVISIFNPKTLYEPNIEITSPNPGDVLVAGNTYPIEWNQKNITQIGINATTIRKGFLLYGNSGVNDFITTDVTDTTGVASWYIDPEEYPPGDYSIHVNAWTSEGEVISNDVNVTIENNDYIYAWEDIKNINVILDKNVVYKKNNSYTLTWESECQLSPEYIWLVVSEYNDGTELVIPLSYFDVDPISGIIRTGSDPQLVHNNNTFTWKVPSYIETVKYSQPGVQIHSYYSFIVDRNNEGALSTLIKTGVSPAVVTELPDGWYSIRVDIKNSVCYGFGKSDKFYISSVDTEELPVPISTDDSISQPTTTQQFDSEDIVLTRERTRLRQSNTSLTNRLQGRILLQVQEAGEAWYIPPASNERYYLKDRQTAFQMLRQFGLGITNADLEKIPVGLNDRIIGDDGDNDGLPDKLEEGLGTDPNNPDSDGDGYTDGEEVKSSYPPLRSGNMIFDNNLANRLKGHILLQVQGRGQAWYINPEDGKRYYMKDGESAFQIMRYLSLGITNDDLSQINLGDL